MSAHPPSTEPAWTRVDRSLQQGSRTILTLSRSCTINSSTGNWVCSSSAAPGVISGSITTAVVIRSVPPATEGCGRIPPCPCSLRQPQPRDRCAFLLQSHPHTVETKKLGGERMRTRGALNPGCSSAPVQGEEPRSLLASRAVPSPSRPSPSDGDLLSPLSAAKCRSGASPPTRKSSRPSCSLLPWHPPSSPTSRAGVSSPSPCPKLTHQRRGMAELCCLRGSGSKDTLLVTDLPTQVL